jgi:electron transfer flavoprotein alpha subunit
VHTTTNTERDLYKNIWVVGEVLNGKVQKVTLELLGTARKLAEKRKCEVWCVLLGSDLVDETNQLFEYQADVALIIDDLALADFNDEIEAAALCRLIDKYKPETILCGATSRGRALIPRVATQSYTGLTADCTELDIDAETGMLLQTRPAFGGNIMATIKCENHRPQMATVRPRVFSVPDPAPGRTGRVINEVLLGSEKLSFKRIIQTVFDESKGLKLSDARIIVAGGRGMKSKANFDLLHEFANRIGGAVGATRAAVDAGWVSYSHQVGQTGTTVQAKVYIACGVSGQIQHLVGMQSCDYIIAINKDPNAPIMQLADVAIAGDLFEIIPAIIRELPRT